MAEKTIPERVLDIIAGQIGDVAANIAPGDELLNDLYCDSLDYVEIMMALETEFEIEIDDDQFLPLITVQQVINHVAGICTPAGEPA